MGHAVTILSHEEAMALPPAERPLNYRIPGDIYHAVFTAISHAMWIAQEFTTIEHAEAVRQSEAASEVAVNLCLEIAEQFEKHGIHFVPVPNTGRDNRSVEPGVHQPVHTTAPQQGHRDQPGSRPVSGEKTSCKAAASLGGSSPSQSSITSHTPSTFAAPTQSSSTADAGKSDATPDKYGI